MVANLSMVFVKVKLKVKLKEIPADVVKVLVAVLKDTAVVNMVGVARVRSTVEQVVNQNLLNVMKLLVPMEDVVVSMVNVQKMNVVVSMIGVEFLVNTVILVKAANQNLETTKQRRPLLRPLLGELLVNLIIEDVVKSMANVIMANAVVSMVTVVLP